MHNHWTILMFSINLSFCKQDKGFEWATTSRKRKVNLVEQVKSLLSHACALFLPTVTIQTTQMAEQSWTNGRRWEKIV